MVIISICLSVLVLFTVYYLTYVERRIWFKYIGETTCDTSNMKSENGLDVTKDNTFMVHMMIDDNEHLEKIRLNYRNKYNVELPDFNVKRYTLFVAFSRKVMYIKSYYSFYYDLFVLSVCFESDYQGDKAYFYLLPRREYLPWQLGSGMYVIEKGKKISIHPKK